MNSFCSARAWVNLFCPYCDSEIMGGPGGESGERKVRGQTGAPGGAQVPPDDDPRKLKSLSEQVDKFVSVLLRANGGLPLPGLEKTFASIRDLQAQMLELQRKEAEAAAKQAARPPAPPKTQPAPRPSVDWNDLGRKLIAELGCGNAGPPQRTGLR
jgi:hypothetical protein